MASTKVLVDLDMQGNRVRNAAASAAATDYVIQSELGALGTVKKYSQVIGNGSATDFTITHNLANATPLTQVMLNSTEELVTVKVVNTDANNTTVTFNVAPATNSYTAIVHG